MNGSKKLNRNKSINFKLSPPPQTRQKYQQNKVISKVDLCAAGYKGPRLLPSSGCILGGVLRGWESDRSAESLLAILSVVCFILRANSIATSRDMIMSSSCEIQRTKKLTIKLKKSKQEWHYNGSRDVKWSHLAPFGSTTFLAAGLGSHWHRRWCPLKVHITEEQSSVRLCGTLSVVVCVLYLWRLSDFVTGVMRQKE